MAELSGLPKYKVETSTKRGWAKVTCPRKACGRLFYVHRKTWIEVSYTTGRMCPYCMKAGACK